MRWWSYAILREGFMDEGGGATRYPTPPRQPDIQPPANWFVRRWRREMDREARKVTRRIVKTEHRRNPDSHRVHLHVWGQERQRAMLQAGWVPLSESGVDMTVYLDIGPRL